MSDLLEVIEDISKEQFLEVWTKEDEASGHSDSFMESRRQEHKGYTGLKYQTSILTQRGIENLVIGHHIHPSHQERVKFGGELLWNVVSRYWQEIQSTQTDECLARLQNIREELNTVSQKMGSLSESDYSLGRVYNRRELAVPGDYFRDYGDDKLYAGNFHRFIGYALWVKEFGYRPIKVYYCERPFLD